MRVNNYLDLSTGHLNEGERAEVLCGNEGLICGCLCIPHTYGGFVHVPEPDPDVDAERRAELPSLHACIEFARALGCMWINFDSDGEIVEGLPYPEGV